MPEQPVDTPIGRLPAFRAGSYSVNAVIETPKGSRNKFKYEPSLGVFTLHSVLTAGTVFPLDFGYIPATLAEDGDPIDVMVLMDEPAYPGIVVEARLIGVIEAEETMDGKNYRNDRLLAVAAISQDRKNINSIDDLSSVLLDQIEHFLVYYEQMKGKGFKILGRGGPERAKEMVREVLVK
jgi:inorganic pyrophosphatase